MKVKVYREGDETYTDLEDKLEKAVLTKKKKREQAYARESYNNDHLDAFHDLVMEMHADVLDDVMEEVESLLQHELGVRNVGQ